jgi:hypothetical protein
LSPSSFRVSFAVSRRSCRSVITAARQDGGQTVLENLALASLHCNRHKGPNIAGTDPDTGEIVRLFHPRSDRWNDHFEGAALTGRTTIGRVTIQVLAINDPDFLAMREALIQDPAFREHAFRPDE